MTSARDIQWGPRTNVALMTDEEVAELAEQAAKRPETPSLSTSTPKTEENKRFSRKPVMPRGVILREPPKKYVVVDITPNVPQEDQWNLFFCHLREVPPDKTMAVYPEPDQTTGNLQLQIRRAGKRHGVSITTAVRNKVVYVRMA